MELGRRAGKSSIARRAGALMGAAGIALMGFSMFAPSPASGTNLASGFSIDDGYSGTISTTNQDCNGIIVTPGSQNTLKSVNPDADDPSSFLPGGTIQYRLTYPGAAPGATFNVLDCVLVYNSNVNVATATEAELKNSSNYTVHGEASLSAVTNEGVFDYAWGPVDATPGQTICNFAKTEANVSDPQASNRKGVVCSTVQAPPGALKVTKSVTGSNAPETWSYVAHVVCSNPSSSFDLTLTSSAPSATENSIPAGASCVVSEPNPPADATVTFTPPNGTVTIASDETVTVSIDNDFPATPPGTLEVTKTVSGPLAPSDWSVIVHIECTNPASSADFTLTKTIPSQSENVDAGASCTVTEPNPPPGATPTFDPSDGTVTITSGQKVTVTVDNNFPALPEGSLRVTKSVSGPNAPGTWSVVAHVVCSGETSSSSFDLTLTSANPSATRDGLPAGDSCTVTEPNPPVGATPTFTPSNGTVSVIQDGTVTVSIDNNFPPTGGGGCTTCSVATTLPPSTTTTSTTSTTVPPTTTTIETHTVVMPQVTSPTIPTAVLPLTITKPAQALAFTGSDTKTLVLIAGILLAMGGLLLLTGGRRSTAEVR